VARGVFSTLDPGAPAVTLGFLTVGVRTAINASAGMLRMPQRSSRAASSGPRGPRDLSAPSTPSHPYPRPEAVITWWAPASTCWHLPKMGTRPSGVPEVLRQRVVRGPARPGTGIRQTAR